MESGDGLNEAGAVIRWSTLALAASHVYRWYESGTGRYTRPDPEGASLFFTSMPRKAALRASLEVLSSFPVHLGQLNLPYAYADQSPLIFADPSGTGIIKWVRCAYYTPRCLSKSFDCKEKIRCIVGELYANDDYEGLNQLYARTGVSDDQGLTKKLCWDDILDCQKMLSICSSPPTFGP